MNIEISSFWLIKDSGCIAIVRSMIGESNGGLKVVYTITDNSGVSSYRMSCEYELFINIAEKLITKSELKDELNKEYVKGKTDGYNEGYQHGFTLAKEKITELDEQERQSIYYEGYDSGNNQWQNDYGFTVPNNTVKNLEATNYKKGLKDAVSINAATRQHHYDMGYSDALVHIASEEAENRLEIKKQGFEGGYNAAIKEMSNKQPLDETTEDMFGAEDCCNVDYTGEKYLVTEGVDLVDFIKNNFDSIKSFNQVGDVGSIEMFDKRNSGRNEQLEKELALVEKYPHYYKDTRHLNIIDIYRFFDLFEVTDPCIQHSLKKLAVGGKRGVKDYEKDIKEAMDTLKRWEYMQEENKRGCDVVERGST